jgi:uncharacterized repeat protein (TIGR01451 family)
MKHQLLVRATTRKTWFWIFVAGLVVSLSAVSFIAGAAPPPPPPPLPNVYFYQSPNPPPPDVPGEVLINEQFKFKVRFKNQNANTSFGYGPFIDLVLDAGGADLKKSCPTCDGITFVKAEMVGVSGGPVSLNSFLAIPPSPCSPTPATVTVNHPFGPFASSGIQPVTMPAGAQLVAIELPFGSFAPAQVGTAAQPEIVVEVTAMVNKYADDGVPVRISARGGFRYGTDPNNNPSWDPPVLSDQNPPGTQVTDSSLWNAQATTTPKVMILKKEYLGPEDETATGPNFPQKYKITVNVANALTLNNLTINDCIPNNVVFTGIDTLQTLPLPIPIPPPQTGPLNNNCVSFAYPTIVGTTLPAEIVIVFQFYVSQNDANGNPVLDPAKCVNALSPNDVKAGGYWVPFDPCDWQGSSTPVKQYVASDVSPLDHLLTDKRLAIQKSVEPYPVATAPLIPGGKLKYTLRFQVSDFFTVGGIAVTDTLADGQAMLTNPAPILTVGDRRGGPTVVPLSSGLSLLDFPNPFGANCGGVNGGRSLSFQVSTAMLNNASLFTDPVLKLGILTGGQAFTPVTSIPATGEIVFYAQIQDTFTYAHTGDKYVDKDDPINNCVSISADMYTNHPTLPVPQSPPLRCTDDSKTLTAIVSDVIKKTVYAVKRGTAIICGPSGTPCSNVPNLAQEVRPGDEVTFRIEKTIPSSDAEQLNVQDWPPLPVFDVNDPDANGTPGPSWPSTVTATCSPFSLPVPGQACKRLPGNTLPVTPTLFAANNSLTFGYGTFNNTSNVPGKIDLLFTITVTNKPFADGLFLTNEAQECENNTFGVTFCQAAIAQVKVREPKLSIKKGVVATDNPKGVFTPPLNPAGIWKPFGTSCPSFNPIINSANVGGLTTSNLSNVDANDSVTFAIAIENTGGAPAYDIELSDIIPLGPTDLPTCFSTTSGLCVTSGNGTPIPFTTALGGHGRTIITLAQPLAAGSPFNSAGTNIVIITFNAQLVSDIKPGCCSNTATLQHYAAQPLGPDFVTAGFTPPFSDIATICVGPKALAKCIVQTSELHTTPQNSGSGTPQVAIGEIIRYRLMASVPEGVSPNFQVKDLLPLGLTYLGNPKVGFVSTNPASLTSSTLAGSGLNFSGDEKTVKCAPLPAPALTFQIPAGAVTVALGSGGDVTFTLGTLTNVESDSNLELVVIEFNALVNNISSNVNGTLLTNRFEFNVDGQPFDQNNAISVNAVVVEPKLVVKKSVTPMDPAGLNTCTVTLTNTGTTDAFDVHITDTLPTGLFLFGIPTVIVAPSGCAVPTLNYSTVSGVTTITVDVPRLAASPGCVVKLTFKVRAQIQCFTNTAQATYTSLPGPSGTQSNPTGSVTPCVLLNHEDCERVYNASGQASITAACPPCANQPLNMVSWWPLNEQVGATVVIDIKGGHNGTPLPSGSLVIGNPQPGKVGGAVYFTNNNISVANDPSLKFGTSNLSIDAWFGSRQPQLVTGIVDKLDIAMKTGDAIYIENRFLKFVMGDGTYFKTYASASQINITNTAMSWHHVAVTVDRASGVGTFYINGAPAGSFVPVAIGTDISSSSALLIGGSRLTFSTCVCEYTLDEIEIFNSVVSAGDIKAIFAAGPIGKCP